MSEHTNFSASKAARGAAEARAAIVSLWRRQPILLLAFVASLLTAGYWLLVASDRYVSQAHVIVQRADLPGGQSMEFSGLFAGVLGGANHADQYLLRDYLLSVDMLRKLDAQLKLREHYSDSSRDLFSRLWRTEVEWAHSYYLRRIDAYFDERSGILYISAQAYDPATAQAIVSTLVVEGERFMNRLAHSLAEEQVRFLEGQVSQMKDQALKARQAVLVYQNREGLISPQATAESLAATLAQLEAKRIELDAQRSALQSFLVSGHPSIVQLDQQIAAIVSQIESEKAKLAAPSGNALNRSVEEFQRLEFEAAFAQEVYKTALSALERGRVEAARTIKKVAVLQTPTLPEYAEQPRRIYNAAAFALVAFLLAGIAHLIAAIIREHKD